MPKSALVSPDRLDFIYDACGDPKRIIIKEITDASKVKLYDKETNVKFLCIGCSIGHNVKNHSHIMNSEVHEPGFHLCKPISVDDCASGRAAIDDLRNIFVPPKGSFLSVKTTSLSSDQVPATHVEQERNVTRNDCMTTHKDLNDTVEEIQASQNLTATEESSTTPRLNRIVDLFNFEYSFNELAERKKRITIYEVDRKYVRQYKITEKEMWYCINCRTACIKKADDDKVEIYGDHQCSPILASEYKVSDKLLFQKSIELKNGSKNASSAMPKSSNVASSSNGSSSKLCKSKKNADTNLSLSSNAPSFRKLKFCEWKFKSNDRSHIIVFEDDNKQYAREYKYDMNSNQVECILCLTANPSKSCIGERNPADFSLMVPAAENHDCVAFRVIENELPKKTANKRKISNKENEPSIVKKSKGAVANVDESAEHENNENSPSKQTCSDILAPPSAVASNISTVQSDLLASTANSNVIVKNQEFNCVKSFFPSGYYLQECCAKLKIPYSFKAVDFWSKIEIPYIAKDSVPRECHSVSEEDSSAFRCFSFLLTGSEEYYLKIKDTLLPYICTNIKALGEKHNLDLVRPDSPLFHELILGRVASKIHFEALVMLLGCRIGVFENGLWDRYGNWEENTVDESCIVLLQKTGGTFDIILSFNN